MIDFTYCPKGHRLLDISPSLLFGQSFFCKKCDKLYKPALQEVVAEELPEGRMEELKRLALFQEARNQVTEEDLVKLGLLAAK